MSKEIDAIVNYIEDSGVPHIRSSYHCEGHAINGYHCLPGTDGQGTAVDFQGYPVYRDPDNLLQIFEAFAVVKEQLAELIYSGADYNIKDGEVVPPYAVDGHWNHVHVATERGVFIKWPKPQEEEIMAFTVSRPQGGYIVVQPYDGGVFAYDGAPYKGSLPELGIIPSHPLVGGAWTPTGQGYWLLGRDGGIFAFGDAPYKGSLAETPHLGSRTPIGLVERNGGYRIVAFDPSGDESRYDYYDF